MDNIEQGVPLPSDELSLEIKNLAAESGANIGGINNDEENEASENEASEKKSSENEADYKKLLTQIMIPGFEFIAPGWGVELSEIDSLASAYAPLLNKYFPSGPVKMGVEIDALFETATVVVPRLSMPRKNLTISDSVVNKSPEKSANDDAPVDVETVVGLDG